MYVYRGNSLSGWPPAALLLDQLPQSTWNQGGPGPSSTMGDPHLRPAPGGPAPPKVLSLLFSKVDEYICLLPPSMKLKLCICM